MKPKNIYLAAFLFLTVSPSVDASSFYSPTETVSVTDTSRVIDLDEIIITAKPKDLYLLRQQPLSATMLSNSQISAWSTRDLRAISSYIPSFSMPNYGSRLTSSMYIRGIGSRINNPAVGVYVDGIPMMNKSGFNTYTYGLERVDVLKGPQGTLYGQNTEGGLVRLYTRNPMIKQGTDLSVSIGTRMFRTVEGLHSAKLNDHFAYSLAAFYTGTNGFLRNQTTGERADKSNEGGGRVRLVWAPTTRLTFDLMSDYQYTDQSTFPYGEYRSTGNVFSKPATTFPNTYQRQLSTTGLNVSYDLRNMLLTSTTSYQYLWDRMNMDQDYVSDDFLRLNQRQLMNAFTQELVLKSNGNSRWQHVTGAFFSRQWLHTDAPVFIGESMNDYIKAQWGMPATHTNLINLKDNRVPGLFKTPQTNIGIYHESYLNITDRLMATIGLRYDYERVSIDYNTYSTFVLASNYGRPVENRYLSSYISGANDHYNQLLPKLGLTWKLNATGSNVYAVWSKGFRAGGYNIQMFSDIFQAEQRQLGRQLMGLMSGALTIEHTPEQVEAVNNTISYKPETSWNYELGTHLNLFDNSIQFDLSLYYMQLRNQQLSVMAGNYGFGRMMVNAGKSYSCGLEAFLRGKSLRDKLEWVVGYGYTHAAFSEYTDEVTVSGVAQEVDYKGNRVPFVPMHTLSLSADYRIDTGVNLLRYVVLGANMTAQGSTYWNEANTYKQPFYALLGGHIDGCFGAVTISLWGKNLTNTRYATFLVSSAATGTPLTFAQQGNRIEAGVDLKLHF